MKKIIEVMRLVESHHIASYYENHLNHILCEKMCIYGTVCKKH